MQQFIGNHKVKIIWTAFIAAMIASFSFAVWRFGSDWTGFFAYTTTKTDFGNGIVTETHPNKTLWDVFELVIIPVVLAVGAFLLNRAQRKSEQEIASNQQQEMLLQNYLDAMTELVLEKHLRDTKKKDPKEIELRNVARSRTLTVLRALDTNNPDGKNRRRGSLVRFLYETQLISGEKPVISLMNATLEEANMRGFDLRNANLQNVNLYKADLRAANLEGANLKDAYMEKTNLRGANLSNTNLNNAYLKGAIYGQYNDVETEWTANFDPVEKGALKYRGS
ncbi:MAG: pentapeptide repeat-containing protein [Chloroflexi bacterium]|nr:pentapeptide repeat-containing protein [Chloroflexota bacterium]